ncbi:hypothetical protein CTAYLR_001675 [Chrysophaeum taylorii]|uniref:SSD domain-containing protein n=1 Tax=Chrysophaeum taylorii TaxID=2483200 RepID=A0AAD7U7D0_9STRA|nr:hypothetical protein CTAYLR_001675 [Chrysophaeum taylorii]
MFFGRIGRACSRWPRLVIVVSVLVGLACSSGLVDASVESNEATLYTPKDSESAERLAWARATFPSSRSRGRSVDLYCEGSNVATYEGMLELFEITNAALAAIGESGAKLNAYGHPEIMSVLSAWNASKSVFMLDENWRATLAALPATRYGETTTEAGVTVDAKYDLGQLVGNAEISASEGVTSARAFKSRLWLEKRASDGVLRSADRVVENASLKHMRCSIRSSTSYRDAVLGAISHDLKLVVLSVILLFVFATSCFVARRSWCRGLALGVGAMASVSLALASAFGLWMRFGGSFHALMGAAIFMVLGLGVDDAFVIVDAADVEPDLETAMNRAGSSILVTSATDSLAFLACALTTSIPALRSFCGVASTAIALDFAFQVTFFVAVVSIVDGAARDDDDDDARRQGGVSPSRVVARFVVGRKCRCAVGVVAVALVALGAVGASKLEMEYESEWMTPRGSMPREAREVERKYFLEGAWRVEVYTTKGDVVSELEAYRKSVGALRRQSWYASDECWIDAGAATTNSSSLLDAAKIKYPEDLAFLTEGLCLSLGTNGTPCATRAEFVWDKTPAKATQISRLDSAQRELASSLGMFVARSPTLEALALTRSAVERSILVAGVSVFACCALLFGRLGAAFVMAAVVAAIDLVLLGGLYWVGEYYNMVTAVILTLAVGLSVDFSAHVMYAYLHAESTSLALARMLPPILKGGVSTLLAVVPMAWSTSYVIRLFDIISTLIVLVGLFFGLAVVPCVLQTYDDLRNPQSSSRDDDDDEGDFYRPLEDGPILELN